MQNWSLVDWANFAQIVMAASAVVAIWGARIAYKQYKVAHREATMVQLLELLTHIEDDRVRRARRVVMRQIRPIVAKNPNERWWEDENLEQEAAMLCASYDHLGSLLERFPAPEVYKFFIERWGETAIKAHRTLQGYLKYRREELKAPKSHSGFTWFHDQATTLHPNV